MQKLPAKYAHKTFILAYVSYQLLIRVRNVSFCVSKDHGSRHHMSTCFLSWPWVLSSKPGNNPYKKKIIDLDADQVFLIYSPYSYSRDPQLHLFYSSLHEPRVHRTIKFRNLLPTISHKRNKFWILVFVYTTNTQEKRT